MCSRWGLFKSLSLLSLLRIFLQLLAEIKKKNRVIQHYLMSLEPGALISEESDIHKVLQSYSERMLFKFSCLHLK